MLAVALAAAPAASAATVSGVQTEEYLEVNRLRARRLGVAGLSVYASGHMSRLADLRLLLLLPLRGE